MCLTPEPEVISSWFIFRFPFLNIKHDPLLQSCIDVYLNTCVQQIKQTNNFLKDKADANTSFQKKVKMQVTSLHCKVSASFLPFEYQSIYRTQRG